MASTPDYGNPRPASVMGLAAFTERYPEVPRLRFELHVPDGERAALRTALTDGFGLSPSRIIDQTQLKDGARAVFERTFAVTGALSALCSPRRPCSPRCSPPRGPRDAWPRARPTTCSGSSPVNARCCLAALALALLPAAAVPQGFAGLAADAEGFAAPRSDPDFAFPEDHGPHPEFRIEWWYVTANLHGVDGARYGAQWTLFRSALAPRRG